MTARATLKPTAIDGRSHSQADANARALGFFSIGLGLVELAAPRLLCRLAGLSGSEQIVRAFGAREIATGVAILSSHDATPWVWGRVAGDVMDIAAVATSLQGANAKKENVALTLLTLAGVTIVDVACAMALSSEKGDHRTAVHNYGNRSGFPKASSLMRGAAKDFKVPGDMRIPEALRPWNEHRPGKAGK